jgi:hypothetical protein
MLEEAPHLMQVCEVTPLQYDEYGKPVAGSGGESWGGAAECFCHDNTQMKQVSVNGELWTYAFHVVYEGDRLAPGTKVRCVSREDSTVIGEGTVKKSTGCYSQEFKGRCDLWLE